MEFLSERSKRFFQFTSFLQNYSNKLTLLPSYHPLKAQDGFIDFGVSENRLMEDVLIERFSREDMQAWYPKFQYYFNYQGAVELLEALASFFQERFVKNNSSVKIDQKEIQITSGASNCFSVLAYAIANPEEYILIETPFYSAVEFDINCISHINLYFVHTKRETNFVATIDDYENAIEKAKSENKKISGMIIVNPGNPIGTYRKKEEILELLNFAKKYEIHVIVDEIYANCIYEEKDEFQSVLSYFDEIPDQMRTHFMWSFSKDFCSAGLRCGVILSRNEYLIRSITYTSLIFSPSYVIQYRLATLLNDKEWLDYYFKTNHERMRKSKSLMTKELKKINVDIHESFSGFFIWIDFRRILSPSLSEKEITFEREKLLFEIFFKNSVYLVPGQALNCSEPGWFRIVFCTSEECIFEGTKRMRKSIDEFKRVSEK